MAYSLLVKALDPELTVRLFEDQDAEAVTDLLHRAYALLGAAGMNFTVLSQDAETTRNRARKGRCWVIERGGEPVATLTISLPPSGAMQRMSSVACKPGMAWLNQLGVSPDLRRQGLATNLWELGQEWAREQGATAIGVDTAVPAERLVKLYQKWGFDHQEVVQWPGKTYESAVMVKPLVG